MASLPNAAQQRHGRRSCAPAGRAGQSAVTPSLAANSNSSRDSPVLSVDTAQPSGAVLPSPGSRDPGVLRLHDAGILRKYVNAERRQTAPIVLSPISPDDADTELVRLLSSVLGVPCSISRREGALSHGCSSTSSTQGSSTAPFLPRGKPIESLLPAPSFQTQQTRERHAPCHNFP